ncbi:MAG: FAD-binding oxidoreductase, partial [Solirubrobacteraceae bacterium]
MTPARRKHWGWGREDEQLEGEPLRAAAAVVSQRLGFGAAEPMAPCSLDDVWMPAPRLQPPDTLTPICRTDAHARARHAYGSSYRDVIRGFQGRFDHPPDVVALPGNEGELERTLDWALSAGAAVIPYGGGTSVVGGVEPDVGDRFTGAVTIDLQRMDRVLEVDRESLAARIQAGASGPALEAQLRGHGLTMRHFPQSFEYATLGGMIATRAAGHFATLQTHIDDLVESIRALTPAGVWDSRRLPGSGAGPSPDRLLLGSEGTLGVISEAWVRVRPRPEFRSSATVRFADFAHGVAALRELSQSGLHPAGCRLIDAAEAGLTGAGDGKHALLLLGFESASFQTTGALALALECCGDHGGHWDEQSPGQTADAWRSAFLRAAHLRDLLVCIGVLSDTFETAITWDRFDDLHTNVMARTSDAVREVCGAGIVTCRITHVYPDGPAPYFTVLAPVRPGEELEQSDRIKLVAGDTVLAAGGTITHH